jgi:hypothetical protein
LADVRGFYSAFAFAPRIDEPDDHVAIEADFGAFLMLKEAYLRAALKAEPAGRVLAAREEFVCSHLAQLGQGLAERLGTADTPRYLATAVRWLGERVGYVAMSSGTHRMNVSKQRRRPRARKRAPRTTDGIQPGSYADGKHGS